MLSWYEIYRSRMCEAYVNHVRDKYDEFIGCISNTERAMNFIEIGCGAGNITKILRERNSSKDARFWLIDNCEKMLGLARENNEEDSRCMFELQSVIDSEVYASIKKNNVPRTNTIVPAKTVVHSHGLLEHFNDNDISTIINNSLTISDEQVHYVPGIKYDVPSRGDERLMSKDQWSDILRQSLSANPRYTFNIFDFNDGYDLILHIAKTESI
jgi:SAM-dependent methyltransferase